MSYDIKGIVIRVGETAQVSERFSKRTIHVLTSDNPKYPQTVEFEATGDRCALLDGIDTDDEVSISFDVRGREWRSPKGETKVFNTLTIWKIEATSRARPAPPPAGRAAGPDDDLPFATCDVAAEPSPIARHLRGAV